MHEKLLPKEGPLVGAVARLIGSLTRRSPAQALRVCYAFALQGTAPSGVDLCVRDLERDVDALEHDTLRDSVGRALLELHPEDPVCGTTTRAFDLGLNRAWVDVFGSVPPCSGAWRNLRLVLAKIENESLADLCRRLGMGYGAAYNRQRRAIALDWSDEIKILASLPDVVVSVVDDSKDPKDHQSSPQWLGPLEPYATGHHGRADNEDVQKPNRLGLHQQQSLAGFSAHEEQGAAGFVLTPPPGGCRSK
jgi:hypothetical protein